MLPKVSIIILNFNGRSRLGEFLEKNIESVLETDYPCFEVVFVDNGSEDHSVEYVKKKYYNERLRIVCTGKNYGYCEGNNLGAKYACHDSEYLVFLNNDTLVDKMWLRKLVDVLEKDNNIGVAGSQILNMDGTIQLLGGNADVFGRAMVVGGEEARALVEKCQPIKVLWVSGASLAIKKNLFLKNGGFDSSFFMYFDEIDLCARLVSKGLKVITVAASIVYHKGGTSNSASVFYWVYRNRMLFMLKNFPRSLFLKCLTIRSIMDPLGAAILGLAHNDSWRLNAIIRAYIFVLKNLGSLIQKRRMNPHKISAEYIAKTPYILTPKNYKIYALSKMLDLNRH